ncbi:MAG: hypothetical protein ACYTBJ_10750 [Planctomycetota bacterium]|jgi:rubrerythrin
MSDKERQDKTIEMLAAHELAIGQLYKAYAEKFPDYRDFWLGLSNDEEQHAHWIRQLQSKIEEGSVHFKHDRFQVRAIQHCLKYAQKILLESQEPDFKLMNALSTAWYLEDALIENKFFEVFETDSSELNETLRKLADATEGHRQRLHKAKAEIK